MYNSGITNTVGRVMSGYISDIRSVSPLVVNIIAALISKLTDFTASKPIMEPHLISGGIFPILLTGGFTYPVLLVLSALLGTIFHE